MLQSRRWEVPAQKANQDAARCRKRLTEMPPTAEKHRAPVSSGGYTLIEMVVTIVILSIIGLTASYAILQSMRVYASAMPTMDASYQAHLAVERMRRDIQVMGDRSTITSFTASSLTFDDSAANTIAYDHAAGDLTRNGALLARGVSAFAFEYWKSDGTPAVTPAELHLVDIDLTVQVSGQPYRLAATVFPRGYGFGTGRLGMGMLDVPASVATAVRTANDEFEIDLVSISASDLVIESFALSSDVGSEELHRLELDGNQIWHAHGVFLPTGTTALNRGSTADRTIPAGASPTLMVQFRNDQSGTVQYKLALDFTNGGSEFLSFSITW